ncbi:MAG TPA: MarR family transcriptional regulator [Acidimicrobiales bacterium]|nr:MarR family transcriptional regulator [Acidimicrobiales bacterium]
MASSASASLPDPGPGGEGWADGLELPGIGLVARIVRLNLLVTRLIDGIAGAEGVATADYLVLAVVRRSPGHRTSPTRISELLGRSTGGMTLTLDRLEAAGWLTRAPDPSDRRRVVVALTDAGLELSTRVNDALHAWERGLGLGRARRRTIARDVDELLGLFDAAAAGHA